LEARSRLVSSPTFGRSRRLIKLLEFTIDAAVAGRAQDIKEYTIGTEVYERGPDFDPRADGIVRVEANRLRQKLAEYYQGAGQSDPVRIDYPKGAYIPEFHYSAPAPDPASSPAEPPADLDLPPAPPVPAERRWRILTCPAALSCVALASLVLHWRSAPSAPFVRPGVAVLSPVNLSGNPADNWLSAALRELLAGELSAGGKFRLPPGELVSRSEGALVHAPSAGLAPNTLADITRALNVETVLTGSYVIAGGRANRQIRVDLHIQGRDAGPGESVSETGTSDGLLELANRLGLRLRERLGAPASAEAAVGKSPAASPAASLYYSGLQRLRTYDPLGALKDLDQAVEVDPQEPMAHLARAQCLEMLGRDPEGSEAIARAFDLRQSLARDQQLMIEALYYRLKHKPEREAEVYRALVTFYPDELEYRFQLAWALDEASRYQDSVTEIAAMRALPAPLNQDPRIDWADLRTAHMQTDFPRRLSSAKKLEEKARRLHSDWLLAEALTREVNPLARANRMPEANAALQESRKIYQRLGDRTGEAFSYRNEGNLLAASGDVPKALAAFNRELAIGLEVGSLVETSNAWNAIGVVRRLLGDLPGARDALQQSLNVAVQRQSEMGIKMANLNLAGVQLCIGDLAGAERQFESALDSSRKLGETEGEALSLTGSGYVQLLAGKPGQALSRFEEAAAIARRASDSQSLAGASIGVAEAYLASHRLDLALTAVSEARRLAEIAGNSDSRIESRLTAGRLAMAEGRFGDAESELRAAKPMIDKEQDVDLSTRWATLLAEIALAQHRAPGAELEQLRNIPSGTPKASVLEAQIVLGRATQRPASAALAEAHRLGLVFVEANAGALAAR
jgi:tetratricopeptide (TPR) repeat protein